jgi:hypothetical protein
MSQWEKTKKTNQQTLSFEGFSCGGTHKLYSTRLHFLLVLLSLMHYRKKNVKKDDEKV